MYYFTQKNKNIEISSVKDAKKVKIVRLITHITTLCVI